MLLLKLCMLTSITVVKAYRFHDLNKFQQVGNRDCWDAMLVDINAKLTTLGSCFYPTNSSLSPHLVPSLFINGSARLPDVLFNPMHYANFLGFTDEMHYSHETFHLSTKDGVKTIKTRGLNHTLAMHHLEGDDEMMKQKYTQFCAVKTHFRPVLDCLSNEIPNLLDYYNYYCLEEESMDVLLGMQLSMINWDLYNNFCEEIFRCSPDPLGDCRAELNHGERRTAPMATMESLCTIMPDFNSMFVPCLLRQIKDCPNRLKAAYNTFVYDIQVVQQQYIPNLDSVRSLCRVIENTCTEHDHWEMMNGLTDSCFQIVYGFSVESGGMYLQMIAAGEAGAVPLAALDNICSTMLGVKDCVQDGARTLPCHDSYVLLVEEILQKLTVACMTYFNSIEPTNSPTGLSPVATTGVIPIRGVTARPPWWVISTEAPFQPTTRPSTTSTTRPTPPQTTRSARTVGTPRVITVRQPPATTTPTTTRRVAQQVDNASGHLKSSLAILVCLELLFLFDR